MANPSGGRFLKVLRIKDPLYRRVFLLIVAVCIIITLLYLAAFSHSAMTTMEEHDRLFYGDLLRITASRAEATLENLSGSLAQITRSSGIYALPFTSQPSYNEPLMTLMTAVLENELFLELGLYLQRDNSILTSNYQQFPLEHYRYSDLVNAYLEHELDVTSFFANGKTTAIFLYNGELFLAQNFPLSSSQLGVLFARLSMDALYRNIVTTEGQASTPVMVFGPENERLFMMQAAYDTASLEALDLLKQQSAAELHYDGDQYYCLQSERTGWRFLVYTERQSPFTIGFFASLLPIVTVILLLGLFLTRYMFAHVFSPIHSVVDSIPRELEDPDAEVQRQSEVASLQEAIPTILRTHSLLSRTVENARPQLTEQFYETLLRQQNPDHDWVDWMLRVTESPFSATSQYCVLVLQTGEGDDPRRLQRRAAAILDGISNAFKSYRLQAVADEPHLAVILEFADDTSSPQLYRRLDRIVQILLAECQQAGLQPLLGRGHPCKTLRGITYSYSEAVMQLEGQPLSLAAKTNADEEPRPDYNYFYHTLRRLPEYLQAEDTERTEEAVARGVDLLVEHIGDEAMATAFLQALADCVRKETRLPEELTDNPPRSAGDPEAYRAELTAYCARLTDHLAAYYRRKSHKLILEAQQYIAANYQDAQLSLSSVSQAIHTSASYLSRLFRGNLEMGFVDYLNSYRIQQACQLLRETELSAKDVAAQCGFNSQQNFFRVFKKWTHVTPKQYREEPVSSQDASAG